MKYLLIAVMLTLTACASTSAGIEKTSGKNPDAGLVRVIGTGSTKEQALNNGFATAIEIVVGSAVLSEKEAINYRLKRDEIIKYSAGYVDQYSIINETKTSSGYTLELDVKIKSSRIHERILNSTTDLKKVDGEQISQQLATYTESKENGDKLLNAVLADYPGKAFKVSRDLEAEDPAARTLIDGHRNPVFIVPFVLTYNYRYMRALDEALNTTGDKKMKNKNQYQVTVRWKEPDHFVFAGGTYYVNDEQRAKLINDKFSYGVSVKVAALDAAGNVLFQQCQLAESHGGPALTKSLLIDGTSVRKNQIIIERPLNDPLIKKLTGYSLTVIQGTC